MHVVFVALVSGKICVTLDRTHDVCIISTIQVNKGRPWSYLITWIVRQKFLGFKMKIEWARIRRCSFEAAKDWLENRAVSNVS